MWVWGLGGSLVEPNGFHMSHVHCTFSISPSYGSHRPSTRYRLLPDAFRKGASCFLQTTGGSSLRVSPEAPKPQPFSCIKPQPVPEANSELSEEFQEIRRQQADRPLLLCLEAIVEAHKLEPEKRNDECWSYCFPTVGGWRILLLQLPGFWCRFWLLFRGLVGYFAPGAQRWLQSFVLNSLCTPAGHPTGSWL